MSGPAVVADYVTVSTPLDNGPQLCGALADVCLRLDGAVTDGRDVVIGKHGRLHYTERVASGVAVVSASGWALAQLRAAGLLFEYCGVVAEGPHKVTHLDMAHDVECDCPTALQSLYTRLRLAGCALTRKRTAGTDCTAMFSRGADGRDTGSIMIGDRRSAETTAIVYDRQHDARRKGKPVPERSMLRFEIRTGVPGLSLRDVVEPEPLFWHFAAPDLGAKPANVASWFPWGEGFEVVRNTVDDAEKLARLIERSSDLERAFAIAQRMPGGVAQLRRELNLRLKVLERTAEFQHGAAPYSEALQ